MIPTKEKCSILGILVVSLEFDSFIKQLMSLVVEFRMFIHIWMLICVT